MKSYFCYNVKRGDIMEFLLFLQEHQYPALTAFFEGVSLLMDKVIVIAIVAYLYWCYDKKIAHKIAVGYFLSGLAVQFLKITFRIPRPWVLDDRIKPSEEMLETATGYSFPSGHTQTATSFCYSLLDVVKQNWLRILLFVFPFLMMFSRMYVLVHSPMDVGVSFVLTTIIVVIAMKYLNKDHYRNLRNICLFVTVAGIIGTIYSLYLVNIGVVDHELGADAIKMMGAILGFSIGCLLEMKYVHYEIKHASLKNNVIIMVLGLAGTLVMKSGLSLIVPDTLIFDFIRYFLTIVWVILIYPGLLMKFRK